jgi:hypothetical protein
LIFNIRIEVLAWHYGQIFCSIKTPSGVRKMRKVIIATAAALFAGGGALAFAVPAFAATAPTPVTAQVGSGALSISAPTLSVNLGTVPASTSAQSESAPLGAVLVTDARGGILGWVATVSATEFTGPQTIPASALTYTPGTAIVVGVATVTPSTVTGLTAAGAVQTCTAVIGINTAAWTPTVAVTIPADALAGTYSATITHSVS